RARPVVPEWASMTSTWSTVRPSVSLNQAGVSSSTVEGMVTEGCLVRLVHGRDNGSQELSSSLGRGLDRLSSVSKRDDAAVQVGYAGLCKTAEPLLHRRLASADQDV